MTSSYSQKHILTEPLGNNAFAWQEREVLYGHSPTLIIPSLIDGTIEDVMLWDDVVFEEWEDGQIRSCTGLRNFVRLRHCDVGSNPANKKGIPNIVSGSLRTSRWQIQAEILIFDNHNHALYFWLEAVRRWVVETGFELIHIDEHSDLWDNSNKLDRDRAIQDEQYSWDFANLECNVGNYIRPALRAWLISTMIRIENEYQIDEYMDYTPSENSILNIDIDIFAPELDHIPEWKKIKIIKNLLGKVKYVTIATSPYFIEQWKAIEKLHQILKQE